MLPSIAVAVLIAAAGKPDWIERESHRWPRATYLTGVGSADERGVAEDRARAEIARVFTARVSSALTATTSESTTRTGSATAIADRTAVTEETRSTTDKVLEGVEIAETWQDPQTQKVYALAVLERAQAAKRLDARLEEIEQGARPLRARLAEEDKAVALAAALRLLRLEQDRRAVEKDLHIVEPDRPAHPSPPEAAARELLAKLSVRLTITGDDHGLVKTALGSALGTLGLSLAAAAARPDLVGDATISRQDLGVRDGWHWSRATVAVVLRDAATSRVVVQLTETARDASRVEGESERRALAKVSEKLRTKVPAAFVAAGDGP